MEDPIIVVGQIYQSNSDGCLYEITRILNKSANAKTFEVKCLDSRVGRDAPIPMTEKQCQLQIGYNLWELLKGPDKTNP